MCSSAFDAKFGDLVHLTSRSNANKIIAFDIERERERERERFHQKALCAPDLAPAHEQDKWHCIIPSQCLATNGMLNPSILTTLQPVIPLQPSCAMELVISKVSCVHLMAHGKALIQ